GLVAEEPAAGRVGNDRALVADDRIGDAGRLRVRPYRPEHSPGDEDHVDSGVACGRDRRPRARPQLRVLPDQRPVEVAGERPHTLRKIVWEDQLLPATDETYAATSAICFGVSWPENEGMTPLPFVTRSITSAWGGIFSSRFGPTVPVAAASFSVWQLLQPAVSKTCFPAVASPFTTGGVATLPITVCGVGVVVVVVPHASRRSAL